MCRAIANAQIPQREPFGARKNVFHTVLFVSTNLRAAWKTILKANFEFLRSLCTALNCSSGTINQCESGGNTSLCIKLCCALCKVALWDLSWVINCLERTKVFCRWSLTPISPHAHVLIGEYCQGRTALQRLRTTSYCAWVVNYPALRGLLMEKLQWSSSCVEYIGRPAAGQCTCWWDTSCLSWVSVCRTLHVLVKAVGQNCRDWNMALPQNASLPMSPCCQTLRYAWSLSFPVNLWVMMTL